MTSPGLRLLAHCWICDAPFARLDSARISIHQASDANGEVIPAVESVCNRARALEGHSAPRGGDRPGGPYASSRTSISRASRPSLAMKMFRYAPSPSLTMILNIAAVARRRELTHESIRPVDANDVADSDGNRVAHDVAGAHGVRAARHFRCHTSTH